MTPNPFDEPAIPHYEFPEMAPDVQAWAEKKAEQIFWCILFACTIGALALFFNTVQLATTPGV